MMAKSLLYKLTQFGYRPNVKLNQNRFKHVFSSKYGKVRIYEIQNVSKASKEWIADPNNRVCDSPGSWICRGQYPPALEKLIAKRKNFKQLEDFNTEEDEDSKKYVEEYHKRMSGNHPLKQGAKAKDGKKRKASEKPPLEFVGCFESESHLPTEKKYAGGATGANIGQALSAARESGKQYFAMARAGDDGHSFLFDDAPDMTKKVAQSYCQKSCSDIEEAFCGCADALCGNAQPAAGEELVRRWAVYRVDKTGSKGKK